MKLYKIARLAIATVMSMTMASLFLATSAQATTGPGWNNLWVRAACVSRYPAPADFVEKFYVWVPNSPQGDKLFIPSQGGLGTYTEYFHYHNVYKKTWGSTYLNYKVYCRTTNSIRTGQILWGGGLGGTHWVSIAA
ncbi:hypothetical protein AB0A74_20270 [Saccharothrix sp. NPDC042600]|uniref:hypothetical protein n=1 Tax=Saccharothrix TaxID=2071 RepID=UPI0033F3AD7B|nr:hypothetical protein GCM10017745_75130 [Saccharothrix mutabilis subsp. capreolus]